MSNPIVLPPRLNQPLQSPQRLRVPQLATRMTGPLPVRVSPNVVPGSMSSRQRAPVGATFSGLGAPMAEGSASVSDAVRAQRDSFLVADGYQVTGQYTNAIRKDAAGKLYVAPPQMPTAGYAARFYNYPSSKMRVGAALAGTPAPGGTKPAWLKTSKYYIPQSPAEHRKAQMGTLLGLGANPWWDPTGSFEKVKAAVAANKSLFDACKASGGTDETCTREVAIRRCVEADANSDMQACAAQYDTKTGFFAPTAPSAGGGTGVNALDKWLNEHPSVKAGVETVCGKQSAKECACGIIKTAGFNPDFCGAASTGGGGGGGGGNPPPATTSSADNTMLYVGLAVVGLTAVLVLGQR